MYIDRNQITEYPFKGEFYIKKDYRSSDGDIINVETAEETILKTRCDIQKASGQFQSGAITARFNVYFPFDKEEGVEIRRGYLFRSEIYGMPVSGIVDEVVPTQMGGCECHLKEVDV